MFQLIYADKISRSIADLNLFLRRKSNEKVISLDFVSKRSAAALKLTQHEFANICTFISKTPWL